MKWTKHGRFHLPPDGTGSLKSHAQLPVIDATHQDYWRIYYSSRNIDGRSLPVFIDIEPGKPESILRKKETPLLELGKPCDFDEHGVMPTAIHTQGNKKLLYYIGWSCRQDVPYQNSIGLAISEDNGDSWLRYSNEPVIGVNDIDPVFTGTLDVLPVSQGLLGYYMSCTQWRDCNGKLEPRYHIRLARSADGYHWERDGHVCIDFIDDMEGGVVAASVLPHNNSYLMWYCYRGDRDYRDNANKTSYRIGMALSNDAIHWQRMDDEAGIDISDSGWDSEMICYPEIICHADTLYMFYNGNGFGSSGIGYATCKLDSLP